MTVRPRYLRRQLRRGALLMECVLALGIVLVAAVLLAQLMATASGQRRLAEQRRRALEEVANRMERVALLPWDRLTAEQIEALPLGDEANRALKDAKLTAKVTDEKDPLVARRILLELTWRNAAGIAVEPVTLTAWRFPKQEGQP